MTTTYDQNLANSYKQKLKGYQDKIDNGTITQTEINQGKEVALQYYEYLDQSNIEYGAIGKEVAGNTSDFGGYANEMLKDAFRDKNSTISESQLNVETNKVAISLAYQDSNIRSQVSDGKTSSRMIADYHYLVFGKNDLPPEAWGGAGSWMELRDSSIGFLEKYKYDIAKYGFESQNLFLEDKYANGVSLRESTSRVLDYSSAKSAFFKLGENLFVDIYDKISSSLDLLKGNFDSNSVDTTHLNLEIKTDLNSSVASGGIAQNGLIIGDSDWSLSMLTINNDGLTNVLPGGIASDGHRPGEQQLSRESEGFTTALNDAFNNYGSHNYNSQSSISDITNLAISAVNYTNIDPLILDLNGDGVQLISYNDSRVIFDVDNDGLSERTGWVSSEDGILVHDKDGDGVINDITETISEYYNPEDGSIADVEGKYSQDGLDALSKLDSNGDDVFNSQDVQWDNLRVWTDANEDGITDEGELRTLDAVGVQSIGLGNNIIQAYKERNEGNVVLSRSTYTDINGNVREAAAVDFTTNPMGYEFNDVNLGQLATAEDGTKSLVISSIGGETVIASDETAQNIFGNSGDDTITGDSRDNWLSGAGSDILNGGDGDDVLVGGGTGNVFVDGGNGDDIIIGGASDDALSGSDGNDYIDGGYNNRIRSLVPNDLQKTKLVNECWNVEL